MVEGNTPRSAVRQPFPRRSLLIAIIGSLAAFAVVLSGQASEWMQRAEQFYADIRTSLFTERTFGDHPDIVLISVGDNVDANRSTFGARAQVDRTRLAKLIEIIDEGAPRAIGIDVPLTAAADPVGDLTLQRALREAKQRVILGAREERDEIGREQRAWSDRFIAGTGRAVGHIASIYEGSRVVRYDSGALALSRTPDSFATLLARAQRPEVRRNFGRIAWLQKVDGDGWLTRWINLGAQQPFRLLYGEEIVDNVKALPPRTLSNKLVIVTSGFAEIERHRTPLSALSAEAVPAAVVQAQAIAQLLDGRTIGELQPRTSRLLLFWIAAFAGIVGWYRRAGLNIGGWLVALIGLVAADVFAYTWLGLTLPALQSILVWILGEAAGRGLRHVLKWEETHGRRWPIEDQTTAELIPIGSARKELA
jgi:CHASE2 domain-containing sensor protein